MAVKQKRRSEAQKEADKRYEKKRAGQRSRNWAFLVYPESAAPDWREKLDDLHIPAAVSPLHDKDCNADGEPKKPHHHVVLAFDSNKTREQVLELVEPLKGTTVIKLNSLVAMLRYLTHMDNPEKQQYDRQLVETYGGLNYNAIIETSSDKIAMLADIMDWVDEVNCIRYDILMQYARRERWDWFELLCNGYTIVISSYIKGKWQAMKGDD